jgi:glycine oxidase
MRMDGCLNDFLIVGGGVIGLSLAYELAGHGATVRVLERGEIGREASWAGAGILPPGNIALPQSPDERLIRLCHDLHPRWAAQLREETGIDNGYRRTGGIYLARSAADAEPLRCKAEAWRQRGIAVEDVSLDRLAEIEPALAVPHAPNRFAGALFAPDEAQLRNPRHLRALRIACVARGVCISEGDSAEDFETAGRRIVAVRTATGRVSAGAVCVTTGSWSRLLLAHLGISITLKPVRGQIALLNTGTPQLRRVVNEGPCYLVPRDDCRVLVGSTEEDVGFVKRTTAEAIGQLLRFAAELAPALSAATLETCWAGLRPATPDGRPYLGRVPGFDNAFVAAGHFRSGLQLSPGTAVVMRQAMLGQQIDIDLAAFRLDRDKITRGRDVAIVRRTPQSEN